jgi:hypothetical protein
MYILRTVPSSCIHFTVQLTVRDDPYLTVRNTAVTGSMVRTRLLYDYSYSYAPWLLASSHPSQSVRLYIGLTEYDTDKALIMREPMCDHCDSVTLLRTSRCTSLAVCSAHHILIPCRAKNIDTRWDVLVEAPSDIILGDERD